MKEMRIIMGMPVEIEVVAHYARGALDAAFHYFVSVDEQFSTYKETSEISRINRGEVPLTAMSSAMRDVFALAEKTKQETHGYFDIRTPHGHIDPSGIVKGWAIRNAALLMEHAGVTDYFLNVGGDIALSGRNAKGLPWSVGIQHPFHTTEIVKVVYPRGKGIATSGSYLRGDHIYNPLVPGEVVREIVSLTVIGPDVLEADRFATGAFAMGKQGIVFIENLPGFEGYMIDASGQATLTTGFDAFTTL